MSVTTLGIVLQVVGVVLRGIAAGGCRGPTCTSSRSWARSSRSRRSACCACAATCGSSGRSCSGSRWWRSALALTAFYVPAGAVEPALQSYWLVIHVTIAVIADRHVHRRGQRERLQLLKESWENGSPRSRPPALRRARPAAERARAGGPRLPAQRDRLRAVDVHRHGRRGVGRARLVAVLGLGPQGGLELHRLGGLRRLPARAHHARLVAAERSPGSRSPASPC